MDSMKPVGISNNIEELRGLPSIPNDQENIDFTQYLPPELNLLIFEKIPTNVLKITAAVSRGWRFFSDDEVLWGKKCEPKKYYLTRDIGKKYSNRERYRLMDAMTEDFSKRFQRAKESVRERVEEKIRFG